MDKQNPFSLYDFLGYFVPGAVAIFGIYLLYNWNLINSFEDAKNLLVNFGRTELLLPFTLFSYIFGHILSYLSSITVERYAVFTLGYPSQFLFGVKAPSISGKANNFKYNFIRIILFPITICDLIIEKSFGRNNTFAKPLSDVLIETVKKKVNLFAKENASSKANFQSDDIFRLIYHYVVENSKTHLTKIQNYVALYGFTRTLTLITVLFSLGFFYWSIINYKGIFHTKEIFICLLLIFFSFVLYMNYLKFLRRFSQEVLLALSVIYPPNDNNSTE